MSLAATKPTQKTSVPAVVSVQEKILLEKQLSFSSEKKGPTVDLYFHELTKKKTFAQQFLRFTITVILSTVFVLSFPLIAALIKVFSSPPIFKKKKVTGRRGSVFIHYSFSTEDRLGSFLKKSRLNKLPSVINIWKGDLNLVGPHPYPVEWCNKWNYHLTDFYKRFSFEPGFLSVAEPVTNPDDINQVQRALRRELQYVLNPSFKKDGRLLMGKDF